MNILTVRGSFSIAPFIALLLAPLAALQADVTLPNIFGDHMVLQRDMAVPVWGTAAPGEKVTVKFRGNAKTTTADSTGNWQVKLDPLTAGGPEQLTVNAANTLTITDVLVGEVWVGSGQSNMQMTAASYIPGMKTGDTGLNKSPGDKHLLAAVNAGPYPQIRIITSGQGGWQPSTPENLMKFSALLQSFGVPLQKKLNVPVGLMVAAVGGTPSGRWLTPQAIARDPACQQAIAKANETFSMETEQKKFADALKKYEADLAAWNQLPEDQKKVKHAPGKPNPPVKPGESNAVIGDLHDKILKPFIGYGIRGVLWDQGEGGTAVNGIDQYTMMGALIRSWRQEWNQGDFPFLYIQKPSGRGCAFDYADPVFGWASDPFEQLPPTVPNNGANVELYIRISSHPNTFMVPICDLGSGTHYWNKSGYGARAARVALGAVYGEKVETSGPVYASHKVEGNKVIVRFTHVGQGLAFRNAETLQGFALAGEDKKFVWADATISGDTVVLSSPQLSQPVFVRYAWADSRTWANLFNKDGLPAIPFRTDP